MSIKSGQRYKLTNQLAELAMDLNANGKSVTGWNPHGGDNQQWILDEQVNGQWTILSVWQQKYCGVEKASDNGTHLVVLDKPQFWDIEILPGNEDPARPSVMLSQRVRGTCFVAEYPLDARANGADLQLWTARGGKNQIWVLEEFSSWLPRINMSIKTGKRYKITNEQTKLVLDLSGINNRSVIGHVSHGGANQQWVIEQQVNGQYIIRSVTPSKFLCIEKTPDNGARLAGLDSIQFWNIEFLPGCDAAKPSVKICQWVRGTCFVADYPIEGHPDVELQVSTPRGGKNQVWVLEEYA